MGHLLTSVEDEASGGRTYVGEGAIVADGEGAIVGAGVWVVDGVGVTRTVGAAVRCVRGRGAGVGMAPVEVAI